MPDELMLIRNIEYRMLIFNISQNCIRIYWKIYELWVSTTANDCGMIGEELDESIERDRERSQWIIWNVQSYKNRFNELGIQLKNAKTSFENGGIKQCGTSPPFFYVI